MRITYIRGSHFLFLPDNNEKPFPAAQCIESHALTFSVKLPRQTRTIDSTVVTQLQASVRADTLSFPGMTLISNAPRFQEASRFI
jgi:hypothetical protein